MKKNINKFDKGEKRIGFAYVLILFLLSTICCCLLLFRYNTDYTVFSQKDFVIIKMNRIHQYQQVQNKEALIVDSLYKRIDSFQPGITALYEESDIKYLLNEMKNVYEQNAWDERYKILFHISNFYDTWFTDKKQLWSKQENVTKFKANLEQCEIGLQNKKDELRSNIKK